MASKITPKGTSAQVPGQENSGNRKKSKRHGGIVGAPGANGDDQVTPLFSQDTPGLLNGAETRVDYGKIHVHSEDDINAYANIKQIRHGMDARAKRLLTIVIVMVVVFLLSAILPTNVFAPEQAHKPLAQLLKEMSASAVGLITFFTGGNSMFTSYVWGIVTALLAGAALGVTGGVYQGSLKNALAAPSTLGVMNGGTLGVIIYAVFVYHGSYTGTISGYADILNNMSLFDYVMELFGTFLCSMLGCFIVVALVLFIAYVAGRGRVTNVSLVIAGQVFAAVISIVISWIRYYISITSGDSEMIELIANSQSSTFGGTYNGTTVLVFFIPLLICFVFVMSQAGRMSLLAFSDDEARSMGIATNRTRILMVGVCTLMTALVISFCGPVGFVGFLVPHLARKLIGPDFRYYLPACATCGAIMVMVAHYVASLAIPGLSTGSTGVFTSIVGCVAFIVIALRGKEKSDGEWL